MKFLIVPAVYILISDEMAGFKIGPFIETHVKMKKKKLWSYEKIFFSHQNSPICMKTTDIKLFPYTCTAKFMFVGIRNNKTQQIRR